MTSTPPVLKSLASAGSSTFDVSWSAVATRTYQLQANADLTTTNWVNVGAPIMATSGKMTVSENVGGELQQFYRVLALP